MKQFRTLITTMMVPALVLSVIMFTHINAPTAYAWSDPVVTPLCRPDADHNEFIVTLPGNEPDYRYQYRYGSEGDWTTVQGQKGNNQLITPATDMTIYVRWFADTNSKTKAEPNTELCLKPTPTPTPEPTPSPTPEPTATPQPTPSPTPTPTPSETPAPTPTVTPEPSSTPTATPPSTMTLPPTDTLPVSGSTPSGSNGWILVVIVSLLSSVFLVLRTKKTR